MPTLTSPTITRARLRAVDADAPRRDARAPGTLDVLFLSASGALGGAERVLLDLAEGIRREEPRLRIGAIVASPGPLQEQLEGTGVMVVPLHLPTTLAGMGDFALQRAPR